jgi:hypothetical protein
MVRINKFINKSYRIKKLQNPVAFIHSNNDNQERNQETISKIKEKILNNKLT